MRRVVDYKAIDMSEEEWEYYNKIVAEFSVGNKNGKEQFRDLFDVDGEGCITMIHPPLKKEIAWAVLFFTQNLMINQRLRKIEKWVEEKNGK